MTHSSSIHSMEVNIILGISSLMVCALLAPHVDALQCNVCAASTSLTGCDTQGVSTCSTSEDGCETEIRVSSAITYITKRCKQHQACLNNALGNTLNCVGTRDNPFCFYCCQGDNCNNGLPENPLIESTSCLVNEVLGDLNTPAGGYLTLFINMTLDGCGKIITSWQFYARRSGIFYASVWKETSTANKFQLLGSNRIEVESSGLKTYAAPEAVQLPVVEGMFLGIAYDSSVLLGVVPYEDNQFPPTPFPSGSFKFYTVHNSNTRMDTLTVGDTVEGIVNPSLMLRSPALKPIFDEQLTDTSTTPETDTTTIPYTVTGEISFECLTELSSDHDNPGESLTISQVLDVGIWAKISPLCNNVSLTWSVTSEKGHVVYSENQTATQWAWLHIQPDVLLPSNYTVSASVSNSGGPAWSMVLNVVAPPLVAVLEGGSYQTIKQGQVVCMDGLTKSYDPVVDDRQDKSGLEFIWLCSVSATSQSCGDWWDSCLSPVAGQQCCNTTDRSVGSYHITLQLHKDNRTTQTTLELSIIQSDSPRTRIRCIVNCHLKVITGSKISLMGQFEDNSHGTSGEIQMVWSLQSFDSQGTIIQELDLDSISDTGSNHSALVVVPNSLAGGHKYCARLTTQCRGCHSTVSEYCFLTNLPPRSGSCQVTPLEGIAMETEFVVQCFGWQDEGYSVDFSSVSSSIPLLYKYQTLKDNKTALMYYGQNPKSFPMVFMTGDENNQHKLELVAEVYDMSGDFTSQVLEVVVHPESEEKLDQCMANLPYLLTSGGTSLGLQCLQVAAAHQNTEIQELVASFVLELSTTIVTDCESQQLAEVIASFTSDDHGVNKETLKYSSAALPHITEFLSLYLMDFPEKSDRLITLTMTAVQTLLQAALPESQPVPHSAPWEQQLQQYQEENNLTPQEAEFYYNQKNHMKAFLWAKDQRKASMVVPALHSAQQSLVYIMSKNLLPRETPITLQFKPTSFHIANLPVSQLNNAMFTYEEAAVQIVDPDFNDTMTCCQLLKLAYYEKNPFIWESGGEDVTSSVLSVRMDLPNEVTAPSSTCDFKPQLSLAFPTGYTGSSNVSNNITINAETLTYHKVNVSRQQMNLLINLKVEENVTRAYVYVKKGWFPLEWEYDFMYEMKPQPGHEHQSGTTVLNLLIPQDQLRDSGIYYLGLKLIFLEPQRNRRSISSNENIHNTTELSYVEYSVDMLAVGCRVMDAKTYQWDAEGCQVDPDETDMNKVTYRSESTNAHHTFAVTCLAPPNMIDFYKVWGEFTHISNNAAVFSVVIVILLLYIALLIWVRKQDKKDIAWHQIQALTENPLTKHQYILTVDTGFTHKSGTKSRIKFILTGKAGDSGIRMLASKDTQALCRGGLKVFLLTTRHSLKQLVSLRVWHDNSGDGSWASWYLNQIIVDDLHTDSRYVFRCKKWLAVDKGDGRICRLLHVAPQKEVSQFGVIFKENSRMKMMDDHLWTSVFFRPTASSFTRVQRLSCCVGFLFLVMICSAMFYKTESNVQRPRVLHLGPLVFSVQEVLYSVVSIVIVFPVHILTIFIFRKTNLGQNAVAIEQNSNKPSQEEPEWKLNKSYLFHSDSLVSEKVKSTKDKSYYDPDANKSNSGKPWHKGLLVLGWVLVFLSILPPAFFIILYSMDWGAEKSNQWLTTFILSLFEDLLIFDPIKVLASALVLTFIMKKAIHVSLQDQGVDVKSKKVLHKGKLKKIRQETYLEPSVRKRLVRERQARVVIREVLLNITFTLVVYSLCYTSRNYYSYLTHKNVRSIFIEGKLGFTKKVTSTRNYFVWLYDNFIPNYFPEYDEDGRHYHWQERLFISDLASYKVGPARLRQVRGKTVNCKSGIISWRDCATDYDKDTELRAPYGIDLLGEDQLSPDILSQNAWNYRESSSIKGSTHGGKIKSYSGGGYIAELSINSNVTMEIIDELKTNFWIDRHTRAVFLDFLLYNPNINLFAVVRLVAEFPTTGGVVTTFEISVIRTYAIGFLGVFIRICQVLFIVLAIYISVVLIVSIVKFKTSPFSRITLFLDGIIITNSLFIIIVYIFRDVNVAETMYTFRQDGSKSVSFSQVVLFDKLYNYSLAFLSLFSSLKFMFLLRLNERFSRLGATLKHSTKPVLGFISQSAVVYMAFSCLFYLWYGNHIYKFATFTRTSESLLSFCLGKFDILPSLMNFDKSFTSVFFFAYLIISNWILVNLLIAVVLGSHHEFKNKKMLHPEDYKLVEVILRKIYIALNRIMRH